MNIRTLDQIQTALETSIITANSLTSTQDGEVVKDVVIDSPAVEFENQYVVDKYISLKQSINGINSMKTDSSFKTALATALGISATVLTAATTWTIPSIITNDIDALFYKDLNDLASNFNLTRTVATSAKFTQRFYRVDDNGSAPITIPLGTTVQTLAASPLIFTTITSSSKNLTFDSTTGKYYVEETVQASDTGTGYNVALGTIKQISPILSVASTTSNTGIATIAQDEESDTSLISRIQDSWIGKNINTIGGYKVFAKSFSGCIDAVTVDPSNTLYLRGLGGADVYVMGNNIVQAFDSIHFVSGTLLYLLQYQPSTSIVSVTGSSSGALALSKFSMSQSGGTFDKSAKANNYLLIIDESTLVDGETLTVVYNYDKLIYDMQASVETDTTNHVVDADILFKQGTLVYIDIGMTVVTFSHQDPTVTIDTILAALINGGTVSGVTYDGHLLGEYIDKSDIEKEVLNLTDIDRIQSGTFTAVRRTGDTGLDPIPISDTEYSRLGTVTVSFS